MNETLHYSVKRLRVFVHVCVSLCVHTHSLTCLEPSLTETLHHTVKRLCVCAHVCVCVCACTKIHTRSQTQTSDCVSLCMHLCVCLCIRVSVRMCTRLLDAFVNRSFCTERSRLTLGISTDALQMLFHMPFLHRHTV